MHNNENNCPHCSRSIRVGETTGQRQREAGLIYLRAHCPSCEVRIDAAGIGELDARLDMERKLKRRIGQPKEKFRIKVRPTRKRRRSR